jgi:hypothetical protein
MWPWPCGYWCGRSSASGEGDAPAPDEDDGEGSEEAAGVMGAAAALATVLADMRLLASEAGGTGCG